jgi:hypothetical protein
VGSRSGIGVVEKKSTHVSPGNASSDSRDSHLQHQRLRRRGVIRLNRTIHRVSPDADRLLLMTLPIRVPNDLDTRENADNPALYASWLPRMSVTSHIGSAWRTDALSAHDGANPQH